MGPSPPAVICPADGQSLTVADSGLVCRGGHQWIAPQGIPRMIPTSGNYADAFGIQWKRYRKTQLDSYTRTPISLNRARRCLGPAWALLQDPDTDVLEVGCGAGRFTEVLLAAGARVTSVDLSTAVEANQENFPQTERHRVLQADVLNLPFPPGQYDIVFCLGVVQHTPSPEATIAKLYDQVRPGGWLVIDHYTYSLSRLTKTQPLFRFFMRRLPPDAGIKWSERLVAFFFPLHRAARHSFIAQALVSRVSPVLVYYHSYPFDDALQREWSLLDTHDALTDWYKHLRTKGQLRRGLERLGAAEIWCEYGGNGVEARCRHA